MPDTAIAALPPDLLRTWARTAREATDRAILANFEDADAGETPRAVTEFGALTPEQHTMWDHARNNAPRTPLNPHGIRGGEYIGPEEGIVAADHTADALRFGRRYLGDELFDAGEEANRVNRHLLREVREADFQRTFATEPRPEVTFTPEYMREMQERLRGPDAPGPHRAMYDDALPRLQPGEVRRWEETPDPTADERQPAPAQPAAVAGSRAAAYDALCAYRDAAGDDAFMAWMQNWVEHEENYRDEDPADV